MAHFYAILKPDPRRPGLQDPLCTDGQRGVRTKGRGLKQLKWWQNN